MSEHRQKRMDFPPLGTPEQTSVPQIMRILKVNLSSQSWLGKKSTPRITKRIEIFPACEDLALQKAWSQEFLWKDSFALVLVFFFFHRCLLLTSKDMTWHYVDVYCELILVLSCAFAIGLTYSFLLNWSAKQNWLFLVFSSFYDFILCHCWDYHSCLEFNISVFYIFMLLIFLY